MNAECNQMIQSILSGDKAAAIRLIELFYQKIYTFLRRLAGNDADASDLTQSTFTRVWRALPTFAGRSSLSSWMHGIAYHVYVDWRRASRFNEARSDEWWQACSSAEPGPDEVTERADLAATLYACVEQLEPDLKHTIHLHYYQGLTLEETAHAMAVATSTVKYRQRQALAQLQKKLAADQSPLSASRLKTI